MNPIHRFSQPMRLQIGAGHGQEIEQTVAMIGSRPVLDWLLCILNVGRDGTLGREVPQTTLEHEDAFLLRSQRADSDCGSETGANNDSVEVLGHEPPPFLKGGVRLTRIVSSCQ